MTRCETGACPCDPLNPRKVALNTFLPAIFGLPVFFACGPVAHEKRGLSPSAVCLSPQYALLPSR